MSPFRIPHLIVLAVFSLHCQIAAAANATSATNVLLIITDEHNFRTLGCYREGLPREQAEMWGFGATVPTPHLDRLADEGVLCTRAYATSPVCSPCRAAMITGRYPHIVGMPTNNHVLDPAAPTLAKRLNKAGYRSTFIGKWHLGGNGKPEWQPKVDGDFQHTNFMFNRGHWKKFGIQNGVGFVAARSNGKPSYSVKGADESSFSTDWLTDRTIDFITDESSTKPFLAVVSYPDPHGPNSVRPPYDHRFDDLPFQAPRTYQTGLESPKWLGPQKKHPVFRGADMSKYFGMVQCLDDNIGRLITAMKESSRLDNTLIIMTSDHGDLCYEHDRQNKGNPYEGSARVPMILRHPAAIKAGQVFTKPMGTVDITPTIVGLLDLPADPEDQGRDLSDQLANVSTQPEDEDPEIAFLRNSGEKAGWLAAVDERYKLIVSVNDSPWLFDAVEDPDELHNFYGRPDTTNVARRLAEALLKYGRDNRDPHVENPRIAASLRAILAR